LLLSYVKSGDDSLGVSVLDQLQPFALIIDSLLHNLNLGIQFAQRKVIRGNLGCHEQANVLKVSR
jgi:hypothetical protein